MSTVEIKENFLSKKLYCLLFGHKIITTRDITNHLKEYKCTVCQLELTNDQRGNKTFLTPELKDINNTLKNFYVKKSLQHI
ncbi:hypothetical protein SAMN05443667_104284 [Flavobacterium gillisiae]|uniref:Prophage protein n=1 Tax=Flavobacterium gillisiae TaxID=150146 RepID=A0A1H4BBV3_9FLAO|nr:hypothetical protein [Flavobacterium gillisiae]SEA45663.1 hypothetical protein SAMN05443667_104284 [Flavobacterium gillisiae]